MHCDNCGNESTKFLNIGAHFICGRCVRKYPMYFGKNTQASRVLGVTPVKLVAKVKNFKVKKRGRA